MGNVHHQIANLQCVVVILDDYCNVCVKKRMLCVVEGVEVFKEFTIFTSHFCRIWGGLKVSE